MAERLNNITYQQSNSGAQTVNFNPRSVSLDIRTPEELAAVNEFLVALGRDVCGTNARPSFAPETYFDPVHLSQLGLTDMPGIGPTSHFSESTYPNNHSHYINNNNSYHSTRSSHPPNQYNSVYTNINEPSINYSNDGEYRRQSGKLNHPPFLSQQYQTPPLENSPPHSSGSSPTPPQLAISTPDNFDYLRASRGAPAVAHLAPPEYIGMSKRPMIPLKALPGASLVEPQNSQPKSPLSFRRPPTSSSLSKPGSLYPLLTSGDIQYKLPPLNKIYKSPSPSSRASTPSSTHSSPVPLSTILPGIRSIARPTESDDLDIGRIELERAKDISQEERKRHAKLILDLLISINHDFKESASTNIGECRNDVEMIVA
jgi:hypothetical protein